MALLQKESYLFRGGWMSIYIGFKIIMLTYQSRQFVVQHQDYFFQDAHYLVEASAVHVATEIGPNIFLFDDGSILFIQNRSETIKTYSDETTFKLSHPEMAQFSSMV